jgi:nitroreductase
MFKAAVRAIVQRNARASGLYSAARHFYHHVRKMSYFACDMKSSFRHMQWSKQGRERYWAISSELLFQYHKLEKGLCMPGEKRFFGYDPASATLELLADWRARGYSLQDPVYLGAVETVRAYRARFGQTPPEQGERLKQRLDDELARSPVPLPRFATPTRAGAAFSAPLAETFEALSKARRSVRSYTGVAVELHHIKNAIAIAQLSPSACNRQPSRVHIYQDRAMIDAMLALQNGNRGFGHTIGTLLVLTAEASTFFDASERHEPYVDGGLFAMSLILALQAAGVSSCCLNWGVDPDTDRRAHQTGAIPGSEKIIMFISIGYANADALVPRSPRRSLDSVLVAH